MLYAGYKLMEHLKIPKNYASALMVVNYMKYLESIDY